MRVISGRLKGRRLVEFKANHIRPTTDRVKETIFNILQQHISGTRVLDLFSGTGNLGIEAWSRGATFVESVEENRHSLRIIRQNLINLKIESGFSVVPADVFKYVKNFKGQPFDIIFVDPPFTEQFAHASMMALAQSSVAMADTLVVIESSRQERIDDKYDSFHLLDRRNFGDKSASIFKKVII